MSHSRPSAALWCGACAISILLTGCEQRTTPNAAAAAQPQTATVAAETEITRQQVDVVTRDWPAKSRSVAMTMVDKYGPPDGIADSILVWHDTGPWKRTVVHKQPVQHLFPKPHLDIVEQFVNYEVPPDLFDELAHFDGSVYADRTAGELSAKCDAEAANLLAVNLAVDIIEGDLTVEEARATYARSIMEVMEGNPPPLTQRLMFTPADDEAGDPGETVIPEEFLREHTPPGT